ncbi:MAG: LysR family transcriptional regulator [Peptococcaceae bacterium]|nr:LysR family transcriptional regulator [Peptococcaceae bacterium]
MEIRRLRYFISVAEHLNFTKAAKQLFVAQSAVSQQIADLESDLGVKLLIRNKRSVKLTSAGVVFLKEAADIINKYDMAIKKARQTNSGVIGSIKIGFLNSAVKSFLPQVVRKFRHEFPNIDLILTQLNLSEIKKALENGELDIGFTLSLGLKTIPEVLWKRIYTDYSSVVLHAEHPLAYKASIDIATLAKEPFVVISRQVSPEGFNLVLELCANSGFSPRIVSQPPLMETVLFLVEAGIGVSIVPGFARIYANSNLCFIKIEGVEANYDIVVVWKKTNTNPSIAFFLEKLREENLFS